MKSAAAVADQARVAQEHLIRPWRCTADDAFYCPIHLDCTCAERFDRPLRDDPTCPLHGVDSTHPHAVGVIR